MTNTAATPASPLKLVRDFFGMKLADMKTEWTPMSEKDKQDILTGLTNGTLTY